MGRIRHFCHFQHGCWVVLEGSAVDFYVWVPLISMQAALHNKLIISTVIILGDVYLFFFEASETNFLKNQKQRLIVIILYLKTEC